MHMKCKKQLMILMDFKDLSSFLRTQRTSQQSFCSAFTPLTYCAVIHFCLRNGGQDRKQNNELLGSFNFLQLLATAIKIM